MRAFFGTAEAVPVQNRFRPVPDSQVSTGSGSQVSTGPDPRRSMAMKRVRYTKFTGDLASEMDIEDLLKALSDYLLDSGFRDPYLRFQEMDHTLEDLREALRQLLESGEMFDDRIREQLEQAMQQGKMDELIDKLIQRMAQENYISWSQDPNQGQITDAMGQAGDVQGEVRFEV